MNDKYSIDLFERFVSKRLGGFRQHTPMWGSREAIELQAILLMEAELRLREPWALESSPRIVFDYYVHGIRRHFGGLDDARSLADRVELFDSDESFAAALFEICQAVRRALKRRGRAGRRAFSLPELMTPDLLTQSLANVQDDAVGDWLRDPWGWPELKTKGAVREALILLRSRLPAACAPIDVAKDAQSQRPAVVMPPIERLAFQIVIDSISADLLRELHANVFGWRTSRVDPKPGQYINNGTEWREFRRRIATSASRYKHCMRLDVREFFACLAPDLVLGAIDGKVPSATMGALHRFLVTWASAPRRPGLPQRCLASSVLANHYLMPLDELLAKQAAGDWCRWMDDIYVFSHSQARLRDVCDKLETLLASLGLAFNPAKTSLRLARELLDETVNLSAVEEDSLVGGEKDGALSGVPGLIAEILVKGVHAPRSVVAFVAKRLIDTEDIASARLLADASDRLPHAADRLARLFRKLGLSRERVTWFLDFANSHSSASDWSVAAWASMFSANEPNEAVAEYFERQIRFGHGAQAILAIAACRLVQWKRPGITELLASRLARAIHPIEIRALMLALGQARMGDQIGAQAADQAYLRSLVAERYIYPSWESTEVEPPARLPVRVVRVVRHD